MRNTKLSFAMIATLPLLAATASFAQDVERMDKAVQEFVDAKQFMGTVLVAKGDQILLNKAYGHANLEWNIANTPNTKFRLGSITKQFTAAGILLLEERGKLKVDDRLKQYYTEAPATWDEITLRHLLTHTSGIPNLTNDPEFEQRKQFDTKLEKTIATFRDKPLDFKPGERMSYSNSGYLMLGYVTEKVSGLGYADFVQQNIFTPLGMSDSGYDSEIQVIARRADGYRNAGGTFINADYVNMSIPHAAGALYSTTEDLLKWNRALYGNKLLKPESLKKMTTPFKNDYAFGLTTGAANGRKYFQHGGGIEGFNTILAYYPDSQVSVVALSNVNGNAPTQIWSKLGPTAHGEAIKLTSERTEVKLPPETLKKYVGTYQLGPNTRVMVRLEGDHLTTQVSGQSRVPTFAESESRFFLKVVDAQWEFLTDATGKVTHAVLYQNGREMKAPKTSDAVAERTEISLPAEALQEYVGAYELRPGFDMVFTLENGQLMLQATNQQKSAVYAEAKDAFFSKIVDASIEFRRDAAGKVSELRLKQGPVDRVAKRK